MPINIQGWIEYSPYEDEKEREDQDAWITWMNVSSLIDFNDEINWIIFGNPRDFNNDTPKFKPIAKNRGFPNNPSDELKADIQWIRELEVEYGKGGIFGFSYFYFSEVDKINWKKDYGVSIVESDWGKLFELTEKFKALRQITSEQIRLTVWYNW